MEPYGHEARYAEVNGLSICYVDEGEGRPLVFIHGLGGSISNWAPNIEYFKRGYRVIALDLPGCGKSSFSDGDYCIEVLEGCVRGLLSELGAGSATFVGNSLGGMITLHLALHHPDLVDAMVIVDGAGGHSFPLSMRKLLMAVPLEWFKKFVRLCLRYVYASGYLYRAAGVYRVNEYTRAILEEAVESTLRPDVEQYLEAYARTARTALSVCYGERLPDISVPTLIVWGQKDLGIPLKVGYRMNAAIKGSFLVAVPEAAHVPQLEQPAIFNAAVERFLEGAGARVVPAAEREAEVVDARLRG